jgi:hypothetical protein
MQIPTPHLRRLPTGKEVEHCISVSGRLDVEIDKIKKKISRLQNQIDTLEAKKTNHLSFISPLRCLPPELISEICSASVSAGVSPLILNQICGRLREVVNDTGELWSRIYLTNGIRTEYGSGHKPSLPKVNTFYHNPSC